MQANSVETQAVAAAAVIQQARGENLDYKVHQGAMHKIAKAGYGVLQKEGISEHTYDDVFQVVSEGYCKALKAFDPARGYQFNTYYFHACRNTMFRWVNNIIREQHAVGHLSIPESQDGDDDQEYAVNANESMHDNDCPAVSLERKQTVNQKLSSLSTKAKMVVGELINPGQVTEIATERYGRDPKFGDLCRVMGFAEKDIKRCRDELRGVYGVAI